MVRRIPTVLLEDTMSRDQIANELAKIIFTAARDWQRSVSIDRNVRDLLVKLLRRQDVTQQIGQTSLPIGYGRDDVSTQR